MKIVYHFFLSLHIHLCFKTLCIDLIVYLLWNLNGLIRRGEKIALRNFGSWSYLNATTSSFLGRFCSVCGSPRRTALIFWFFCSAAAEKQKNGTVIKKRE
jgi:hypothetical protein